METPTPTANDIAELVAFLPRLYAADLSPIVRWGEGVDERSGVSYLPWPEYADVVHEFFEAASKPCWRDYGYSNRVVPRILARADGLANLGIDEVKSVLTFCVRGERFCDGYWARMIEAGHVRRVLERLAELGAETPERSAACPGPITANSPWPDDLQRQWRAAIAELSITQDGYLKIKHIVLGDAALFAFDDGLLVHRFRDGRKWKYPNVEALLTDGWAIE